MPFSIIVTLCAQEFLSFGLWCICSHEYLIHISANEALSCKKGYPDPPQGGIVTCLLTLKHIPVIGT